MSKIRINQINENEVEVFFDNDIPYEMVEKLNKGLEARGLFQDNSRSSLGRRCFVRAGEEVDDVHEKLMKSLEKMVKADSHTKLLWEGQRQQRLVDRNERRKAMGLKPITADQMQNPAGQKPAGAATPPAASTPSPVAPVKPVQSGAGIVSGKPNTLFDPERSGTVNYAKKSEDGHEEGNEKCPCPACSTIRKAELNKSLREKLGGSKWGQHRPFPSAHQPGMDRKLPTAEQLHADQLADLMMNKGMMKAIPGAPLLGSVVPPQPTDEQLFGHLVPTEEMIKSAERRVDINSFYAEAMKPISARFKSEEEEITYWRSLKVNPEAGSID